MTANKTFVILGPDDGDGIPQHWDREFWRWMEGAAGAKPSSSCVYSRDEVFAFPPKELPGGGVGIINVTTGWMYKPLPYPGEGDENNI